MEKSLASQIIDEILKFSYQLSGIDALLRNVADEAEQKALLRTLGVIMVELDADLIRPLVRQHPDLDPDR